LWTIDALTGEIKGGSDNFLVFHHMKKKRPFLSTIYGLTTVFSGLIFGIIGAKGGPIPVQSFSKDATGMTLKMSPGLLRIEPVGDLTFHVV
jgi:hypothetical protein